MPAVDDFMRSTTKRWITHLPMHCPNGRRLGREVLVGHQACPRRGGGHTTWTAAYVMQRCMGQHLTPTARHSNGQRLWHRQHS